MTDGDGADVGTTDTTATDTATGDADAQTGTGTGDGTGGTGPSDADVIKGLRADLEAARKELTSVRREAAGHRTRVGVVTRERDDHAGRAARFDTVLAELGVEDADGFDVKAFAEEYRGTLGRLSAERLTNQVMRAARRVGADPDLLLDSTSFQENARQLDPSSDDYAAQVEALVTRAVEASPAYRAGQAPPVAVSGAEIPGGSGGQKITDAELKRLYAAGEYEKIAELVDSGQAASLLGPR